MSDDDHPVLTAVGFVAVALGVLMVFRPGLATVIGTDYVAVTVVGLLALVQGLRVARDRKASELRAAETPDVETVETMPTPGDEFDRQVAKLRSGPRRSRIRKRVNYKERLTDTATTAVADRENCSRDRAQARIEAGTWTDDVHAAAFLGGDDAPNPPLLARLKLVASARPTYPFRIRRTADAIARVAGVADDPASTKGRTDQQPRSRSDERTERSTGRRAESPTEGRSEVEP